MTDLRLALRGLRSTPIVTAVAIASLALGIGAMTAIFSLVNSLLLRSLPVENPGQLVLIGDTDRPARGWSNPIWERIHDRQTLFEGTIAWGRDRLNLARGGEAQYVDGLWVSGDFFKVLGVPAALGRVITSDDDRRGGDPVAVIAHDFWQRHFSGARDVIGKPLVLNSVTFTIVGVARQGFFGVDVGQTFDVAVPIGTEPLVAGNNSGLDLRGRTWLTVMARLRAGREIDATSAELRSLHREIRESMPPTDPALGPLPQDLESPFSLVPAATGQSPLRGRYQQALLMLLVVSVTVLLIACINIANLLVARAIVRRREMSLRMALGAPRMRLARLMLVEAVMLSGVGAVLGMALAQWMSRFLVSRISTPASTVFFDLTPDWRVWGFAAGSSLATAAIFGVAPAWQSMRADPVDALKEQGRGTTGARRSWLSPALVSAQIALSLVLVVAAGLFVRTSAELAQRHVGGTRDRVLLVNVAAPMTRYALEQLVGTYDRVLQAISTVPGVERAAISDITPAGGSARTNFVEIPSGDTLPDRERLISINVISPGWLQTYGVRLESGRDFSVSDGPQSRAVALVNRAFVRRFFSGVNAVGQVISVGLPGRMTSVEIVGVVEDTVYRSLREPPSPTLFTSTTQRAAARPYVNVAVLAAAGSPAGLSRSIAAAVGSVDPDLVLQFRPLADQVTGAMSQERIVALLSSFFGGLALLLAGLGLYGLTAYNIGQQRSEIAMRIALGAGVVAVMRLVMRRAALLMASGVACGALLSLWASRFVEALVYGLQPRDPATFALAALVLTMVTALATAIPAWRASRIDPVEVLKEI